jgi:hypothetical protein
MSNDFYAGMLVGVFVMTLVSIFVTNCLPDKPSQPEGDSNTP